MTNYGRVDGACASVFVGHLSFRALLCSCRRGCVAVVPFVVVVVGIVVPSQSRSLSLWRKSARGWTRTPNDTTTAAHLLFCCCCWYKLFTSLFYNARAHVLFAHMAGWAHLALIFHLNFMRWPSLARAHGACTLSAVMQKSPRSQGSSPKPVAREPAAALWPVPPQTLYT